MIIISNRSNISDPSLLDFSPRAALSSCMLSEACGIIEGGMKHDYFKMSSGITGTTSCHDGDSMAGDKSTGRKK
jgi:hypothetical protein